MMAPNLLARFRPLSDPAEASIYETIREHDEGADNSDDEDVARVPGFLQGHARPPLPSDIASPASSSPYARNRRNAGHQAHLGEIPKRSGRAHSRKAGKGMQFEEIEDDVPASLLIEDTDNRHSSPNQVPRLHPAWEATERIRLPNDEESLPIPHETRTVIGTSTMATATSKEKALWRWANVENLDNFLADVYEYYICKGYWSMVLKRLLKLLTVVFVIGFCLFLTQCIEYTKIRGSLKLDDILVNRCTARMGFVPNSILWLTTFFCITRCFKYVIDLRRLKHLHDFYLYLLDIPEAEIQSISWQEVVSRLMALRDSNPNIRTSHNLQARQYMGTQSKSRMDAHDIANRLMRKDNYIIAMINKDVLDTTLAVPLLGRRQLFTRTLEWHLNYCIMDYVFNNKGQVRQLFLKDTHRRALSEGLRRRFIFAGAMSLIFAPVLIIYFVVENFFQHFNEYQKDPAQIGSRQYNTFAQWKFREFNELWHLFDRRLKMSHPFATRYINQFPKDKTVQAARFVTFVSGAIISVLGLATVLDQENFLGFEITNGRTTIFYLGVFGSIWAVARGMLPDDNMVYDSSYSMEEVMEFTHYKPPHWDGRLHTVEVKAEFEKLYQMQLVVLLEEILSMIFTPFVLWLTLPQCSDRIIDFFREFTVSVDGLGYVCSFAEFNFKKPAQTGTGANAGTRASNLVEVAARARENEYYAAKDDKMEQSYHNFMNDYTRNPKTDIRYSYLGRNRGKQFHAPPPFPGPLSPTSYQDNHQIQTTDQAKTVHHAGRHQNTRRDTEHMATDSLLQSVLLDPHHQPGRSSVAIASPTTLRTRRYASKSRILPTPGDTMMSTALKEEDEEEVLGLQSTAEPLASAHNGHSNGDLGSWKYEDELGNDSEPEEDADAIVRDGGVLGLIKQFQKAHDDDKRGGNGV